MIRLNAITFLEKSGKSRYWLAQQLGTSTQNLNFMLKNETASIRYETIEALCQIFKCTPNELFIFDEPPYEDFPLKTGLPEVTELTRRTKQKKTPKEEEGL